MELLSHAIKNELQRDLHIHDSAILPNFVSLPQVRINARHCWMQGYKPQTAYTCLHTCSTFCIVLQDCNLHLHGC